jgi:hypothetical protein
MTDEEKSPDWKGYGIDQVVVEQWVRTTFGDKMFESKEERAARVLEEAVELYQVFGPGNRAKAHKIVDMVFDKKVGELHNELGGLIVTLLAVCGNEGRRLCKERGLTRIDGLVAPQNNLAQYAVKELGGYPQAVVFSVPV